MKKQPRRELQVPKDSSQDYCHLDNMICSNLPTIPSAYQRPQSWFVFALVSHSVRPVEGGGLLKLCRSTLSTRIISRGKLPSCWRPLLVVKKTRAETEYEETPRKPPRTLIHCAKRTIVHATNVGSMGARNLQNCNVEIHHHVHESPVKEMKSSKMLNEPKLKITLEEE